MTSDLNDEFCRDHSSFCVENLLENLLFFSKSALANEMITKIFKNLPHIPQAGHPFCIILFLEFVYVHEYTHTHTHQRRQAGQVLLCIWKILSVSPMVSLIFVSGRENITWKTAFLLYHRLKKKKKNLPLLTLFPFPGHLQGWLGVATWHRLDAWRISGSIESQECPAYLPRQCLSDTCGETQVYKYCWHTWSCPC